MKKEWLNRRQFIKSVTCACIVGAITSNSLGMNINITSLQDKKPKGLVEIILSLDEKNIREKIREKANQIYGCYLFGNSLDVIESKIKSDLEQGIYENEFVIPENFLVKEMDFLLVINRNNLLLDVFQKYNGKEIHLLNTGVALGGINKDYSTGKWRNFSTPKGDYFLKRIINKPFWFPPKWAEIKKLVKSGRNNPYGLWMSELSLDFNSGDYNWGISGDSGIRIHSTNKPKSIGSYSSHGCIRVRPNVAENELFPGLLHNSNHDKARTNSRGTIYPLYKPIPISIKD